MSSGRVIGIICIHILNSFRNDDVIVTDVTLSQSSVTEERHRRKRGGKGEGAVPETTGAASVAINEREAVTVVGRERTESVIITAGEAAAIGEAVAVATLAGVEVAVAATTAGEAVAVATAAAGEAVVIVATAAGKEVATATSNNSSSSIRYSRRREPRSIF